MTPHDPAAPAEALLDEIAHQLARSTADVEAATAAEVAQIRQRARDKARQRLRRTLAELRAVERQQLHRVRAELDTERRHRLARDARHALDAAWPRVGEALRRRWADAAARGAWIDALLGLAVQRLGTRAAWTLRHPPGLADALRAALVRHGAADATLVVDATLDAGLVIEADGARLDGTPAALLADQPAVEAELLAQLAPAEPDRG